jgi:N-acetylglucosaminyldiphosphoundecaprenol N-acetyl-beta-D-mannosaminyltransferase
MPASVNILGVHVNVTNVDQTLEIMDSWISRRDRQYICAVAAHVVMDAYWNPDIRGWVNRAALVVPDGMSIVWLIKSKGYRSASRVYAPGLVLKTCERFLPDHRRHFFYGGDPGVADMLAGRLTARFPGLQVAGIISPSYQPLTSKEDETEVRRINDSQPDILWLGITSPKQIRWMAEHVGRVNVPVMIGVGASFDFLSGHKKQAPPLVQRAGLEWLFRLATEPRRLWPRYSQYPLFAALVFSQSIGLTRYD